MSVKERCIALSKAIGETHKPTVFPKFNRFFHIAAVVLAVISVLSFPITFFPGRNSRELTSLSLEHGFICASFKWSGSYCMPYFCRYLLDEETTSKSRTLRIVSTRILNCRTICMENSRN